MNEWIEITDPVTSFQTAMIRTEVLEEEAAGLKEVTVKIEISSGQIVTMLLDVSELNEMCGILDQTLDEAKEALAIITQQNLALEEE